MCRSECGDLLYCVGQHWYFHTKQMQEIIKTYNNKLSVVCTHKKKTQLMDVISSAVSELVLHLLYFYQSSTVMYPLIKILSILTNMKYGEPVSY